MALVALAAMVAPLGGYVYVGISDAYAQAQAQSQWQSDNPRAETWRDVRQGVQGVTTVQGPEAGVLIQNGGQNWRQLRNGPVASYTPWVLALTVGALAAIVLVRGRDRLKERPSGRVVERWTLWDRVLHWVVAVLFILLAITGLSILFGRAVWIPLLGAEGFAAYASFAKAVHNYTGPFFAVGIVLMILTWLRYNLPQRGDLNWIKGQFKGEHPPVGRFNPGEKVWFWFIAVAGGAVVVAGLVMNMPIFGQTRETMQIANLVHSVGGMLWVALFLGHAFMGTYITEGAMSGMTNGYVSVEWAKQHHALWYDEVKSSARPASEIGAGGGTPGDAATTARS